MNNDQMTCRKNLEKDGEERRYRCKQKNLENGVYKNPREDDRVAAS